MLITIVFYILLLTVFLIVTGLIIRYTLKFSDLSPNFKYVVSLYVIVSAFIIIFSLFLLMQAEHPSGSNGSTSQGELDF